VWRDAVKETAKLRMQGVVTDATKRVTSAFTYGAWSDQPEPPWWRGRRSRPRRTPIDRDAIIDAAIRILDDEGVDALTVRRLATELQTGPATLYWHISGKDELGELVYDRIMGAVRLPEPDPGNWQAQLKEVVRDSYRVLSAHNDAVKLSLGRVSVGPNMLRIVEWTMTLLRQAGVPDAVAGYFGDLLGRYIDVSVLEEAATATLGGQEVTPEEAATMLGEYFASLPVSRFPNLVAMADVMFELGPDERFDLGLDVLIRGFEAYATA
jgi:AcrR family transcriptional regulator